MSAYMMAQITIHDRDAYAAYEAGFMDIFNRYKGKLCAVDEAPDVIEGVWQCTRLVLVEFPTKEDALDWFNSEPYQALAKHRHAASTASSMLAQGLEDTAIAP